MKGAKFPDRNACRRKPTKADLDSNTVGVESYSGASQELLKKYIFTRISGPSGPVNSSSCKGLAHFARKTHSLKKVVDYNIQETEE